MFTLEEKQKICHLYQEEKWFKKQIAEYFSCSTYRINNVLKEYNIPTRKRKINVDLKEDFFKNIDTEEKAYILGLLFTDGSVTEEEQRQNQMRLELQAKDIPLLNQIKEIMGIKSKITLSRHKNSSSSISESALISVRSDLLVNDLNKYGIIKNKTYKTSHLPSIAPEMLPHFMRGLIDGDGSIYKTSFINNNGIRYYKDVIYFCSYHRSVCEDFKKNIEQLLGRKSKCNITQENKGKMYRITYTKQKDTLEIATLLYKDNKISLARKYELAKHIYEGNNEDDIV